MVGLPSFFKGGSPRGATAAPAVPEGSSLSVNEGVEKRQRMLLFGVGGLLLTGAGYWLFFTGNSETPGQANEIASQNIKVSTDDLAARNLSEKEWLSMSENRLTQQDNQIRRMSGQGDQLEQMQAQIDALKSENSNMASEGTRVLSAYDDENRSLKEQLAAAQSGPRPGAGPTALYGPGGPAAYDSVAGAAAAAAQSRRELKVISFAATPASTGGAGKAPTGGNMFVSDSPNYLPANSYAKARVIVGVDAASNVQSQSDPLPVVLRIVGPARSVAQNGKVLTTRIDGCLVNGAARGDLSSEKVYVKLAKMTCPQPGGRYAESEVKGFIAFGGKTGVRGRVVSREGSLTMQAFFAGLVGGIGRGFSANSSSFLSGATTIVDGKREKLSTGDIAKGGIGEGVSQAGDMLSQYLIERAEQYQPVIEMPTGVEVEIVFLDGAFVRN
jgi:conjugal transfer pilus assembly protein TraB